MPGYSHRPTQEDVDVVGLRAAAQLVDLFVGGVFFAIPLFLAFLIAAVMAPRSGEALVSLIILIGFALAAFAVLGYSLLIEGIWDGYSVGKYIFGIKVVMEDGGECTMGASVIRNVVGWIDRFFYYAVGLLVISVSDMNQRIGDHAASTVVVKAE